MIKLAVRRARKDALSTEEFSHWLLKAHLPMLPKLRQHPFDPAD